jgi:hypothetical protein
VYATASEGELYLSRAIVSVSLADPSSKVIRSGKPKDMNIDKMDGNIKIEKIKGTISIMLVFLTVGRTQALLGVLGSVRGPQVVDVPMVGLVQPFLVLFMCFGEQISFENLRLENDEDRESLRIEK